MKPVYYLCQCKRADQAGKKAGKSVCEEPLKGKFLVARDSEIENKRFRTSRHLFFSASIKASSCWSIARFFLSRISSSLHFNMHLVWSGLPSWLLKQMLMLDQSP